MQRASKRAIQKASRSDELGSERSKKPQRSERPRPAIHEALGGQEVGVTAERSEGRSERDSERQRPSLARSSVVLAGSRPAEKLSPEIGASTYSCLKA